MSSDLLRIEFRRTPSTFALFAFGFRPFFLLGALSSVVLMMAWVAAYATGRVLPNYYGLVQWHAHEMLFGFVGAIIAGFLLTAPAVWTERPMPRGLPLAGLALLWMAARILPFFPAHVSPAVQILVDISFLPFVAIVVLRVVWQARQWRNAVFPPLLLAMAGANALAHAQVRTESGVAVGTELMLYLVILLISILAGRVIPFFTRARLQDAIPQTRGWVEASATGSLFLLISADLLNAPAGVVAGVALLAGIAHFVRLRGWYSAGIWRDPLLWVLFLAYGWLIAGFLLTALSLFAALDPTLARHAFTTGGIGGIIMGMMCRITLGHTGRPLRATRATVIVFVLMNVSAGIRVVLPALVPSLILLWVKTSAALWVVAFAVFLATYGPLLWRPRADGRPG